MQVCAVHVSASSVQMYSVLQCMQERLKDSIVRIPSKCCTHMPCKSYYGHFTAKALEGAWIIRWDFCYTKKLYCRTYSTMLSPVTGWAYLVDDSALPMGMAVVWSGISSLSWKERGREKEGRYVVKEIRSHSTASIPHYANVQCGLHMLPWWRGHFWEAVRIWGCHQRSFGAPCQSAESLPSSPAVGWREMWYV